MVDPVVATLFGVAVAFTKTLLRSTNNNLGAEVVGDTAGPLAEISQLVLGRKGSKKQVERAINRDLATRMRNMHERCYREGIDPDRLANPCAEVEAVLDTIGDHKWMLEQAVHDPDALRTDFKERALKQRVQIDERLVPYFDELIKAVVEQYIAYAERSPNYLHVAAKQSLKNDKESREADAKILDAVGDVKHMVGKFASSDSKPSRVFFGSRPDVVAGERFVKRDEQKHLHELIVDPTRRRTVLVGMRGCGKTQLAASLAEQCEEANWNLVAWINAASPDTIQSDLVELAKRLKIDTSDQPAQDVIVRRCLDHLKSAAPADRLIVFDNVEDINHLTGLIPSGDGVRVVATTTDNVGWEDQAWTTIRVGVFDRKESIRYLLTDTKPDDHDSAEALAERLGDLPLAIAQAAAFAQKRKLDLAQYLDRLDAYRSERVMPAISGHYYARDVATALRVAIDDTLKELETGMSRAARRHLGVLALLAESGVPTRWLDPLTEEHHYQGRRDRDRAADDDAHDALTELIDRSIIQQSADGTTTMLHRLQAQVLRESWSEEEREQACESAATLLGSVNIDSFDRTDTESRRREARSLIEQFHAIGDQKHSLNLRTNEPVTSALSQTLTHARDLGLVLESVTLEEFAKEIEHVLGPNDLRVLNVQEELAYMIMHAGRSSEAINMYEDILDARTKMQGSDHHDTLTTQQNLAYAYYYQGDEYDKAIKLLEHVHSTRQQLLGDDDVHTLMAGSYLALVYHADGRLQEAMSRYKQVIADRTRLMGAEHEHTLVTRNNLAYAYALQGLLPKAIDQYEQVLSARTRKLGSLDRQTLMTRSDLALAYALNGELAEAVGRYESVLKDCTNALGTQHPLTVDVRESLEAARRELAEQEGTSHTEERVED